MSDKHPLEKLFGEGIVTGIVMYAVFRWILRPIGRGIAHLSWRWRRFLTPLWFGTGTEIVALIWRFGASWTWWVALVLPVCGTTLAVLGPRLSGPWSKAIMWVVPDSVDAGRKGVLDRVPERIYVGTFTAALGGWLALRVGAGPSTITEYWWLAGTVGFGGVWWYHRRIRVAGRSDRYARRWRILSNKDRGPIRELHGSKVVAATGTRGQSLLTVRLREGATAAMAGRPESMDQLASFYGMRLSSVYLLPVAENARQVQFRFLPRDPWKGNIPHPMPAPGSITLVSTDARFPMGLHADGNDDPYRLQHTLLVGASGSGKSIWLRTLMIWLSSMQDCHIIAADMAGGATLAMWQPVLDLPLATDFESTCVMLTRVMAWIESREEDLRDSSLRPGEQSDVIEPSVDTPWLVVIIDEYPDFVAEANDLGKAGAKWLALIGRIGKRIRKCGGKLILACQNGSKADTGAKELQSQLTAIVSLMLDQHASSVLWGDQKRYGWYSHGLKIGQYLLQDSEHKTANIAKGFYVRQRDVKAHIDAAARLERRMEPKGWKALTGAGAAVPEVDDIDIPAEGADKTHADILAVLDQGPGKADDIATRAGVARATVYRHLAQARDAGEAHALAGTWMRGPEPVRAQASA
jgi:hypothetical protein